MRDLIKNLLRENIIESGLNEFSKGRLDSDTRHNIWWHGSTDAKFEGKKGIHIGTKLATTQALEARIGVPAEGEWNGKREYGKTLLAGKIRLQEISKERGYGVETGFNVGRDVPDENYYPTDRKERATYSDGTPIPFDSYPIVFRVSIIGDMSNTTRNPYSDTKANSMMYKHMRMGNARRGYYYINDGEDYGSISAVVPDGSFLIVL